MEGFFSYRQRCRCEVRRQLIEIKERLSNPGITEHERKDLQFGVIYLLGELRQIDSILAALPLVGDKPLTVEMRRLDDLHW